MPKRFLIDNITPQSTLTTGATNPTAATALDQAKKAAKDAIQNASSANLNSIFNTQKGKVETARDAYDTAIQAANLAFAKNQAKSLVNTEYAKAPQTKDPDGDQDLFDAIKEAQTQALVNIQNANTSQKINQAQTKGVTAIQDAITAYNQDLAATKLTKDKNAKKILIDNITPQSTLTTGATNPTAATALDQAKTAAKDAIQNASSSANLNSIFNTQKGKVETARDAYDTAIQAANLAFAKNQAKSLVNTEYAKAPKTKDPDGDQDLFDAIKEAKENALTDIQNTNNHQEINQAKTKGVTAIQDAITAYNQDLAATKLTKDKNAKKILIDNITPQSTLTTGATNPTAATALDQAKTAAKDAIQNASSANLNSIFNTQKGKVETARDAYDTAIQAANLAFAKNQAKSLVNTEYAKAPKTKDPDGDQDLFDAIKEAKENALTDIQNTNNHQEINQAKTKGVTAIQDAITAYNQDLAATKLTKDKNAKKILIDNITPQSTLTTGATNPTAATALDQAKTAAKDAIQNASSANLNSIFNTQKGKVETARDAYDTAIQAANLAFAKNQAKSLVNTEYAKAPKTKDPDGDQDLFDAIKEVKNKALTDIQNANNHQEINQAKTKGVTAIQDAITAYNQDLAATKLTKDKNAKKILIDNITPQSTLTTGATNPTAATALDQAKTAAKDAIQNASSSANLNSIFNTQKGKVETARDAYDTAIQAANLAFAKNQAKSLVNTEYAKAPKTKDPDGDQDLFDAIKEAKENALTDIQNTNNHQEINQAKTKGVTAIQDAITAYNQDLAATKLTKDKNAKKILIDNITPQSTLTTGATNPTAATALDQAKTAAKDAIQNASSANLNSIFNTQKGKVETARDAYDTAIQAANLAFAKNQAKSLVNTEYAKAPQTKDPDGDQDLFDAIKEVKNKALTDIQNANNHQEINQAKTKGVTAIQDAITAYNQDLAATKLTKDKNAKKILIDNITPQSTLTTGATNPTAATALDQAKTAAKDAIQNASSSANLNSIFNTQKGKVETARDAYDTAIQAANLAFAKNQAKSLVNTEYAKAPKTKNPNGDQGFFDAIKEAKDKALTDIQNANTSQKINQAQTKGVTAIQDAIMAYNQDLAATKLANDKNAKKAAIDNINPQSTLTTGATNPTAATALAQAKKAAKDAIQNASSANLNSIFNTQKGKVETARDAAEQAIQAANLAFAKNQAKDAVKAEYAKAPQNKDPEGDQDLFDAIKEAHTQALVNIQNANTSQKINQAQTKSVTAIQDAITAYNQDLAATKLAKDKNAKKAAIYNITPQSTITTGATNPTAATALAQAKKAAKDAIENASSANLISIFNTQKTKVETARDAAEQAIQAANLAFAKNQAKDAVKAEYAKAPQNKDPEGDQDLFDAIKEAQTQALVNIQNANTSQKINQAQTKAVTAIQDAIMAYKQNLAATKLANDKNAKKAAIDNINPQSTLTTGATNPTAATALAQAKTAAKNAIENASSANLNSIFNTQKGKVETARDAAEQAIQAANLAFVKTQANNLIKTEYDKAPQTKDTDGDQDLFDAIKEAYTQALVNIQNANTSQKINQAQTKAVTAIQDAITAYNQDLAATKLANDKNAKKAAIDNINPQSTLTTGATDPTAATALSQAKKAAKDAIQNASSANLNSIFNTQKGKVETARDAAEQAIQAANLAFAKNQAKSLVNTKYAKAPKTKDPDGDQDLFDAIKEAKENALTDIQNTNTSQEINQAKTKGVTAIQDAITAYNQDLAATKLTKDKNAKKILIDNITPQSTLTTGATNPTAATALDQAKTAAKDAIQNASSANLISIFNTQKGKVETARDAYDTAIQAANLAFAKNQAKSLVNTEYAKAPQTKYPEGDQDLFDAIKEVKNKALTDIQNANNHQKINQAQTKGVTAIQDAITAYKQNLAATKLANDKNAKKAAIDNINPQSTLTIGATNPTAATALAQAKKAAKDAIQNASSANLNSIFNTQKGKVETARDAAEQAIQAANLAFAKNQAKDAVKAEYAKAPKTKDPEGDQDLFDAIKEAHTQALADIQNANTSQKINQAQTKGVTAIKNVSTAYNQDLAATKLANDKNAKKAAIDNINPQSTLTTGATDPTAATALAQAKKAAKDAIQNASSANLNSIFNTQKGKVETARDAYDTAIQAANLAFAKNQAKSLVNTEYAKAPKTKYPEGDQDLFDAIKEAKENALTDIQNANNHQEINQAKTKGVTAIQDAITAYNQDLAATKLTKDKNAKKILIDNITPQSTLTTGATNPTAATALDQAKTAAKDAIQNASSSANLNSIFNTQKGKVETARDAYDTAIQAANLAFAKNQAKSLVNTEYAKAPKTKDPDGDQDLFDAIKEAKENALTDIQNTNNHQEINQAKTKGVTAIQDAITAYNQDLAATKLTKDKNAKKILIDNITPQSTLTTGATNPTAATALDQAKTAAKDAIQNASSANLNSIFNTQKGKVETARDAYDTAIQAANLAFAKNQAKSLVNTEYAKAPKTKDPDGDQDLFDAIKEAKENALTDIQNTNNHQEINQAKTKGVTAIQDAITAYNQDLAATKLTKDKNAKKILIDNITPQSTLTTGATNPTAATALDQAKTAAKDAIQNASSSANLNSIFNTQKGKVETARDAYDTAIQAANLAFAKNQAKSLVNTEYAKAPKTKNPNGDQGFFDAIKEAKDKALTDIQNANTSQKINQAQTKGVTAIQDAIMAYNQDLAATKLANDKNAKKAAIDNINPQSTLTTGATNPTAATALAQAKKAAKDAIQNASSANLNSIFNTQKGKVETARDAAEQAIQAANLAFAKNQAKDAVKAEYAKAPQNKDPEGDQDLFDAIKEAHTQALVNIQNANTSQKINQAQTKSVTAIQDAITAYNQDLAATKLAKDKNAKKAAIYNITPQSTITTGATNPTAATALAQAKKAAKDAIENASSANLISIFNTQKTKVETARDAAEQAIQAANLAFAKNQAKDAVKAEYAKAPQNKDPEGDQDLFDAIKEAQTQALVNIQNANTSQKINQAQTKAVTAIQDAIMAYKQNLAATKLANDKNAKKAAIDNINPQSTLTTGATNPTAATALAQAKTAAKNAIENASSANLNSIFNTQKGKVETARDAAEQAIQAANLAFVKTQANNLIKTEYDKAPQTKDTDGDQDLFDAIKEAYTQALVNIQNANTSQKINQAQTKAVTAIQDAITAYNQDLAATKLANDKNAKKAAIDNINPQSTLTTGATDPTAATALAQAKKAAKDAIQNASSANLNSIFNTQKGKVETARDAAEQAIQAANLAFAKNQAKSLVNTKYAKAPKTKDPDGDQDLFDAIKEAKENALTDIQNTNTSQEINQAKTKGVTAIQDAITAYNQDLAATKLTKDKNAKKILIDNITPQSTLTTGATNPTAATALDQAKTAAKDAIQNASSANLISIFNTQKGKVETARDAYDTAIQAANLAFAKNQAKSLVNTEYAKAPQTKYPEGDQDLFDAIKEVKNKALTDIQNANNHQKINQAQTKGVTAIQDAITAYKQNLAATKLANDKNAKKAAIDNINPQSTLTIGATNPTAATALAQAKKAAKDAIQNASSANLNSIFNTQKGKVETARDAAEQAIQAANLAFAKNQAKDAVKAEYAKAPKTKDPEGDQDLFDAIKEAHTQALADIQNANTSQKINQAQTKGVTAIKNVSTAYNQDLAATKLANDKNAKKAAIDNINPQSTLTTGATDPTAATALAQAKKAAKDAIQNASSANLNSIFNTQKGKVETARDAAEQAIQAANLAFAKNQAKDAVKAEYAKAPQNKDPDGDQDLFDAIKEAQTQALVNIQNANTSQKINQAKTKGVTAIKNVSTAYKQNLAATKLANDKNAKKAAIDNINPQSTLTIGATDPTAATALAQAKKAAKDAIQNASSANLISIFNTQKGKVETARDAYDTAIQAANLAFAKNQAKDAVKAEYAKAPQTKYPEGDQDLFDAIKEVKNKALTDIQNANNHQEINQAKTKGVTAIQDAITAYNQDLAATKLTKDKNAKKILIDKINPQSTLTTGATNPTATTALDQAKTAAKDAIQNASSSANLNSIFNTQKGKVETARDAYDTAIQAANLAFAKNQAKSLVNTKYAKAPKTKDPDGDQDLFDAIKEAKENALTDIQNTNTSQEINQAKTKGVTAIQDAITAYNQDLAATKLTKDKNAKKILIDNITPQSTLTTGATNPTAATALDQAKTAAKDAIQNASSANLNSIFNTQKGKVETARDAYDTAIQAANLAFAKNQAKSLVNTEYAKAPKTKYPEGDQDLFDAIKEAKENALTDIQNANNHQEINQAKTKGVTAIQDAITAYNQDLAATKLTKDKNAKKILIDKINPQSTLTTGATNPTATTALDQAKTAAKDAIQNASSSANLNSIFNTQKGKVETARDAYDTAIQAANLAFAKNQAKSLVNTEYAKAPKTKYPEGDQDLFDAIKEAKENALTDIQNTNNHQEINQAKTKGLTAIQDAITAYNQDLAATKLTKDKNAKKILIDNITPQSTLTTGATNPTAATALDQAKTAAKDAIQSASSANLNSIFNTQKGKVETARDAYDTAIQAANLAFAKNQAKSLVNTEYAKAPKTKDPEGDQDLFDAIKEAKENALTDIQNTNNHQEINQAKTKGLTAIQDAITAYNQDLAATKLTKDKNAKKILIDNITPQSTLTTGATNPTAATALDQAKTAAKDAIQSASSANLNSIFNTQKGKVETARDAYDTAIQAANLAFAKNQAKSLVNTKYAKAPKTKDPDGDQDLFDAIKEAKENALTDIQNTNTSQEINQAKTKGVTAIQDAITAYNQDLAATKLTKDKNAKKILIDNITPQSTLTTGATNPTAATALDQAKTAAKDAIQNASSANLNSIFNTQKGKVETARDAYDTAIQAANLAFAKNQAKSLVNTEYAKAPKTKYPEGDQDLFDAIKEAKENALTDIQNTNNHQEINQAKTKGVTAIQDAITAYNQDLAATKLTKDKNAKKILIDNITPQSTLTTGATNPTAATALDQAKTAAKDAIQNASSANLNSIFNTQKGKVETARDAYDTAIQAANLAFAKNQAKSLVNTEYAKAPQTKDPDGDQDLFDAIKEVKNKALTDIQNANNHQEINQAKTKGVTAIQDAITAYNQDLAATKLTKDKNAKKILIDNITPQSTLTTGATNPTAATALDQAKTAAKDAIQNASSSANLNSIFNTQKGKVETARDAYDTAIQAANLAFAKNQAKSLVNTEYAKAPQTKDPEGDQDLFDAIKEAKENALTDIQNTNNHQEINQAKTKGVTAIQDAITAYNQDLAATKLTKDKNAKKILIDNITPQSTLTTGATNPTAATALDQAKTAAKDAIQNASSANLNSIFNTQKGKVETARDAYDTAIQAANLAFAKNQAKSLVNTEYAKAPKTKDPDGDQDLFDAIKEAKENALTDIQNTNNHQEINQAKTKGVTAIQDAITAYNQDLAATKLTKDKNAKKILIDNITPQSTLTTGATNPTAATALDQAKTAAKDAIQNASSSANLNSIFNTQKGKVETARDAYDTAIQAANLAFAKNQAKSLVNTEYAKAPKTKDPDGDQDLFDAIKEVKNKALTDIQNANNHQEINQAKTKGVTAIQDAITAYNQDLAATKLTKDKNAKKILIDNITPQSTLTTGATNPTAATALDQAKTAAKDAIQNASSSANLNSIFNTQKGKVETARDAYDTAIQAANLAFAKNQAKSLVNTEYAKAPKTKNPNGDQGFFDAIKEAKDKALTDIQNANTSQEITQAKEDGLKAIDEAIKKYNQLLNMTKFFIQMGWIDSK